MVDLWTIDGPVLAEIVQQTEVEGRTRVDNADVFEKAGVTPEAGNRSLNRLLDAEMIRGKKMWNGPALVMGVTKYGLRESGAWPRPKRSPTG